VTTGNKQQQQHHVHRRRVNGIAVAVAVQDAMASGKTLS